jgi:hypothetical protein
LKDIAIQAKDEEKWEMQILWLLVLESVD